MSGSEQPVRASSCPQDVIQLQSFSTDCQPAHRRIDYWHHITGVALTTQVADPLDREAFCGRMTRLDLGDVRLVELRASGSKVSRTRAHLGRSAEAVYLLRLPLRGEIATVQQGREAHLGSGDFTLCDTSRPYEVCFREPPNVLILRIPRARLLSYIGRPEAMVGVLMRGDSGLSGLASRYLREIWCASRDFMAHGASLRMVEISLQLLASAYSALPNAMAERSHVVTALRAQAIELIERDLTDPELTPSRIAAELHITPGYLHRIFSGAGETIARHILLRRLEKSARALRDPLQAGRSITAIAFGQGFNSLAHFSRVFRERYGVSPRDHRHGSA